MDIVYVFRVRRLTAMVKSRILFIIFAAILAVGSFASSADGCYAVVVGKDASTDGAVLLGHNEQNYGLRYLNFRKIPRIEHNAGEMVKVLGGAEIPQVKESYAFLWSENPGISYSDGYLNEWGVAVVSDGCPDRGEELEKLEKEGLFDPELKRPIPPSPKRIGIVTSPSGAALRDILNTIRRRSPIAEVFLSPAQVQGAGAPEQIIEAFHRLEDLIHPEIILIARGGGSIEDLWAFNNEDLARTIAASKIPVICGVGHETDFTIADFVADLRAPSHPIPATPVALLGRTTLGLDMLEQLDLMRQHRTCRVDQDDLCWHRRACRACQRSLHLCERGVS